VVPRAKETGTKKDHFGREKDSSIPEEISNALVGSRRKVCGKKTQEFKKKSRGRGKVCCTEGMSVDKQKRRPFTESGKKKRTRKGVKGVGNLYSLGGLIPARDQEGKNKPCSFKLGKDDAEGKGGMCHETGGFFLEIELR